MARLLLILALLPLAAQADPPAKKPPSDGVEIWPPPAPGTDQAGNPKPAKKPAKAAPVDAGSVGYQPLDPELTAAPSSRPAADPAATDEDEDSPCVDDFGDCSEACAVEHSNDDTLHVPKGKKLPVQKCVDRCAKKRDTCEEQREAGFTGKDDGEPSRE